MPCSALGNVLAAAARRLNHLVHRARAFVHEAIAKRHGAVIDNAGHLERPQLAVATARPEAALLLWFVRPIGRIRRIGPIRLCLVFVLCFAHASHHRLNSWSNQPKASVKFFLPNHAAFIENVQAPALFREERPA